MVRRLVRIIAFFIIFLIFLMPLKIVSADMDSFMDGLLQNYQEYYQKPGMYESGTRNYMSFGAYSMRLPPNKFSTTVFEIKPPRLNIDCSGIDFEAGAISLMNWDKIKSVFKDYGSTIMSGFLIGLAYSVPTIENMIKQINDIQSYAQQLNFEPCKFGLELGMSAGKKIQEYFKSQKESDEMASGDKDSYAKARKKNPDISYLPEGNIVWEQLSKKGYPSDLIEPIINLTGTIIFEKVKDEQGNENPVPKVITGPITPDILLNGGETSYWTFSGIMGSNATQNKITVKGLIEKNEEKLKEIVETIRSSGKLSDEQKKFLTHPSAPFLTKTIQQIAMLEHKYDRDNFIEGLAPVLSYFQTYYMMRYAERAFREVDTDIRVKDVGEINNMVKDIKNDFNEKKTVLLHYIDREINYLDFSDRIEKTVASALNKVMNEKKLVVQKQLFRQR